MIVHDVIFAIHETWPCLLELDLFPKTKSVLSFDISECHFCSLVCLLNTFLSQFPAFPSPLVLGVQVNHSGFSGLHLYLVYR